MTAPVIEQFSALSAEFRAFREGRLRSYTEARGSTQRNNRNPALWLRTNMQCANAAEERLIPHVAKTGSAHVIGQRVRRGKIQHRLWQVGIGCRMFGHQTSNQWQYATEVGEVESLERLPLRRGKLEDDEPRAGAKNSNGFAKTRAEVGQVADTKTDGRSFEYTFGEWKIERVGIERNHRGRLGASLQQHRQDEVSPDHGPMEPRRGGKRRRQVEGSGAEIEITTIRYPFPAKQLHRLAPPAAIYVEAEEMIEKIVSGGDCRKNAPDVRPLGGATGDCNITIQVRHRRRM